MCREASGQTDGQLRLGAVPSIVDGKNYSGRSKVQLSTKKVQLFACATAHKCKIGRSYMLKKGAARFARHAFFAGVGPSNSAFVCNGTGEKLDLFGRKLDL